MIVLGRVDFTVNAVVDGFQGYRFELRRDRMVSESSGEIEVSLDAGVGGRRLASPHTLRNFR